MCAVNYVYYRIKNATPLSLNINPIVNYNIYKFLRQELRNRYYTTINTFTTRDLLQHFRKKYERPEESIFVNKDKDYTISLLSLKGSRVISREMNEISTRHHESVIYWNLPISMREMDK